MCALCVNYCFSDITRRWIIAPARSGVFLNTLTCSWHLVPHFKQSELIHFHGPASFLTLDKKKKKKNTLTLSTSSNAALCLWQFTLQWTIEARLICWYLIASHVFFFFLFPFFLFFGGVGLGENCRMHHCFPFHQYVCYALECDPRCILPNCAISPLSIYMQDCDVSIGHEQSLVCTTTIMYSRDVRGLAEQYILQIKLYSVHGLLK